MPEFAACLGSPLPRVFATRLRIPHLDDPAAWAVGLVRKNAAQASLQVTEDSEEGGAHRAAAVAHLDPTDPASLERFANGVLAGQSMHGRLELLHYSGKGGELREDADWVWDIARQYFIPALHARNPLGFYLKASLWLSAGEHRYAAHCDLADGFLIHLSGHKRVRVWPVPADIRRVPIFSYGDFAGRMSTTPLEYELRRGQILFIPGGAMHDVVAEKACTAVSVSFHMGSPYPLLTLCAELNTLLGVQDIYLPEHMQGRDKFDIWFFQPADYLADPKSVPKQMPAALVEALAKVLQCRATDPHTLRCLLDQWWAGTVARPRYQSPYPSS